MSIFRVPQSIPKTVDWHIDGEEFPLLGGCSGSGLWYLELEEPHTLCLIGVILQALENIVLVYLPDKLFIPKN